MDKPTDLISIGVIANEKDGMEVEGPSLPSNYVSILELKQRWLQQHHPQTPAKSNPRDDGEATSQPDGEAPVRRVPRQRQSRPRVINQIIPPEVAIDDSGSKIQADAADNHPQGEKEEHKTDHSNSELSKKKKKKKKKGSRAGKPRSVTDEIPIGGGSPPLVPEAAVVKEKKQAQHVGGGGYRSRHRNVVCETNSTTSVQNVEASSHNDAATVNVPIVNGRGSGRRNQGKPKPKPRSDHNVVCESSDKRTPFSQNVDDLSHNNAARSHGVVKAVTADVPVNSPIVSQSANRRGGGAGTGRFQGKPRSNHYQSPFNVKKGETSSLVWAKKGESSSAN